MNFIKAWQSLPDYGVSLFVVRFHGEKKDELLGVAANKIMRMTLNAGDHIKTWRFSTMKVIRSVQPATLGLHWGF
jgi:kindlin 2